MAMISKNAKQPMEGAASASMPWGAATGAEKPLLVQTVVLGQQT